MFWSCCAAKGGVGTSVVTGAVASTLARSSPTLLVDFGGDQSDLLGIDAAGPGVWDWLRAESSVGVSNLSNVVVPVTEGLDLLPAGTVGDRSASSTQRAIELVEGLGRDRMVVADLGVLDGLTFSVPSIVAASSARRILVLRACYLGLRRAQRLDVDATDVVEVVEGGRALRTIDIEAVLGRPVTARLPVDPRIARCVDAGLVLSRMPRSLRRLASDLSRQEIAA